MKAERPILFSAPMVRAILAGTKTQTRRVVKGAPDDWAPVRPEVFSPTVVDRHGDEQPGPDAYGAGNEDGSDWVRCPYGQPGDRLWVRETWMADPPVTGDWPSTAFHGCKPRDHSLIPDCYRKPEHCLYRADGHEDLHGWTPGIHMFRWASRITLEVTGTRVERLQDISKADAVAEGIVETCGGYGLPDGSHFHAADPRESYWSLWGAINGCGGVEANPWVWVVEFRRSA